MSTLIEFYDKDTLKNITAPLTLKPDKVAFIYDEGITDLNRFKSLEKCFRRHMPKIVLEYYPVNILSIDEIYITAMNIIKNNIDCMMELTGGSELMLIAGYKAGSETNIKLVYTDLIKGIIFDLNNKRDFVKTLPLRLVDFVDAKGAEFIGNSHIVPEEEDYERILKMCDIIFDHVEEWKATCTFFQTIISHFDIDEFDIKGRIKINQNGKKVSVSKPLLNYFVKYGFIKNLNMTKENIRFTITSKNAKQYIINFGIWLELYVYIHAKKINAFTNVVLGAMIDWDAYDGVVMASNEFDIIVNDNSMPVFISCKMRDADTAALNELVVAKKRFGGWFSKCVLVSFGKEKEKQIGTLQRANQLGIAMLDKKDILSNNFGERLVNVIREQDLLSLKWIKI